MLHSPNCNKEKNVLFLRDVISKISRGKYLSLCPHEYAGTVLGNLKFREEFVVIRKYKPMLKTLPLAPIITHLITEKVISNNLYNRGLFRMAR